jgi:hypothetical protein
MGGRRFFFWVAHRAVLHQAARVVHSSGAVVVINIFKYFPGPVELSIFATMSIGCATVAWHMPSRDLAISAVAFPLFLGCAIFSLWKHGRLDGAPVAATERVSTVVSTPTVAEE